MTRARTASYGGVTPPPLDHWIEAVLMLCVSHVQGVATTLRMILNRRNRDWHTETAREALPRAMSGIQRTELEADEIRVPGEGRYPVLRAKMAPGRTALGHIPSSSTDAAEGVAQTSLG